MPDITSNAAAVLASQPDNSQSVPSSPTDLSAPLNGRQTPQLPGPQTPPAVDPAAADVTHHALFGKAVKALVSSLHGETTYRPNPQTGQVEAVTAPAKPGAFFKNLLVGALVGASAGTNGGGGFVGAFGRGAGAAQQQREQRDQQAYDRARQAESDTLEKRKSDDDHVYHQALTAHEVIQTSALLHNIHSADQETIDRHNASARAYEKSLIDAGARPVQLTIEGKPLDTVDGNALRKALSADPSILHGPDGCERHFISSTDLSELHHNGESWVDDSGNPVNMGSNISIRAYDLPSRTFKSSIKVTGKKLIELRPALAGTIDPEKSYTTTFDALSALHSLQVKEDAEAAMANNRRSLANQRDKNSKQATQIESKKAAALAKAEHNYWTAINGGKDPDNALAELNSAKQAAQDGYENEIRAAGGTPQHFEYGNAPAPQRSAQSAQRLIPPTGKSVVYDPQNKPHFVDSDKLKSFLADPKYRGWHQ